MSTALADTLDPDHFVSGGLSLAYREIGTGPAVVLLHGIASTGTATWMGTGWTDALLQAGWRCLVPDLRGHGASERPARRAGFVRSAMAVDALELVRHARAAPAVFFGYSLGARLAVMAAIADPSACRGLILGGTAGGLLSAGYDSDRMSKALMQPPGSDAEAEALRRLAVRCGNDIESIIECLLEGNGQVDRAGFSALDLPILVVTGSEDPWGQDAHLLRAANPRTRGVSLQGHTHSSTIRAPEFRSEVLAFLAELRGVEEPGQ